MPDALMIFAAGFGTRMGTLTADRPKPLIEVAGKTLLDHALALAPANLRIVVNVHYRAAQIRAHLARRPEVLISDESAKILETGGGLRAALPLLAADPVFVLNSDGVWTGENPLQQLARAWDHDRMDVLLLLLPAERFTGHRGTGDFVMDAEGRLERAHGRPGLTYIGAHITRTNGLSAIADEAFSLNILWDRAIAEGRAFGLVHQGGCADVGRPEGIAMAEKLLADG
ncbi:MAG: nucleotidyltransferase family protein [Gemmobacter sp.]|uniref:nucleotidyltransferase family protein n=1 Tax=Gemmobacter sp. TaxID=1898957 RepID=UPI001A40A916|nr:nucleotidyltransferase family protein [Gemmobacter sp.]MBL8561714.1 nucleotidyltransferase family protein [Gemmobacter sp.]